MTEHQQSRAAYLVAETWRARRAGRDRGFVQRLSESFGDSYHSPAVVADLADLGLAAVLLLAEARGESFAETLVSLDQPAVVRVADTDAWLAPAAA